MEALYAASSVHSFFNNEDPTLTHRCCPHIIMRMCTFILLLYMKLQLTHAASPPELYWKSMLPTTPMPKSIADLLHSPGDGTTFRDQKVGRQAQIKFAYGCRMPPLCSGTQPQDKPNTALFFLEKDLKAGHKMKFLFKKTSNQSSFLPRQVVKSIPFSSTKMAEILNKFAVKPGSINAEDIKNTIKVCEESGIKGEEKYCATSLESMIDFAILKFGKNLKALSTEVINKKKTKKQEYTITQGVEKLGETKVVACHKLNYVYAMFYCHKIQNTAAYTVPLDGVDGSRVKAVSVCHRDTSLWNPKHLAFQMLKVKPGSGPICHFLFRDTIVWVPIQN